MILQKLNYNNLYIPFYIYNIMATIADISSGDFVYNTFDYRDPTKIGPAAWTTVYLLNLKPTDYIVDTSILKNNLFEISTTVLGLNLLLYVNASHKMRRPSASVFNISMV